MDGVSIQVVGMERVARALTAISNPEVFRKVLEAIGQDLTSKADLTFREETDPWGNSWEKLAPATLRSRRKGENKDAGDKILHDSGDLAGNMHYVNPSLGDLTVAVGTNVPYGKYHQFGTKKGLVRRAFLPVNKDGKDFPAAYEDDLLDIIRIRLEGALP